MVETARNFFASKVECAGENKKRKGIRMIIKNGERRICEFRPRWSEKVGSLMIAILIRSPKLLRITFVITFAAHSLEVKADDPLDHWHAIALNLPLSPIDAAFGDGRWVAVSYDGIYTSTDAVSWTIANITPANDETELHPNSVVFGNSLWIASGPVGIALSNDGTNWTRNSSLWDGNQDPPRIIYGNQAWVLSRNGASPLRSHDGLRWGEFSVPLEGEIVLQFDGVEWLALGSDFAGKMRLLASLDLSNWTIRDIPNDFRPEFFISGRKIGNYWVYYNWCRVGCYMLSPDLVQANYFTGPRPMAWNGEQYLSFTPQTVTSPDGVRWVPAASVPNLSVGYANGLWLGLNRGFGATWLLNSTDAVHWTASENLGSESTPTSIRYAKGIWAMNGRFLRISRDGRNWMAAWPQDGGDAYVHQLYHTDGGWAAPATALKNGAVSGLILYSVDGENWSSVTLPVGIQVQYFTYANDQWFIRGSQAHAIPGYFLNRVWTSKDLNNPGLWESGAPQFVRDKYNLQLTGGIWLGLSAQSIVTSADGITWTKREPHPFAQVADFVPVNGRLVSCSELGLFESEPLVSLRGITASKLAIRATPGILLAVESSSDLVGWTVITNISAVQSDLTITDVGNSAARFYRARTR